MGVRVELREGLRPEIGQVPVWGGDGWEPRDMARDHDQLYTHTRTEVRIVMGPWRSPDFVSGSAGWQIDADGSAEFNDITARGTIYATAGEVGGWTIGASSITGGDATLHSTGYLLLGTGNDVVRVDAADSTYRLWIGNATAASASFRVTKGGVMTATGATITGTITATAGTIGGWTIAAATLTGGDATLHSSGYLLLGTGTDVVRLDATDATYRLWIGDTTGAAAKFSVTKDGDVLAQNATIRGSLRSSVIEYGLISATAGTLAVVPSAGKLLSDVTTVASPTTFNVDIEDPESGHAALFSAGDILRLKDGTSDAWLTVSSVSDQTTFYRYVCTLSNGDAATFAEGLGVLDYGQSGDGGLILTADESNAPYLSIFTHAGSPWTTTTEMARLGNLNGGWGYSADAYGLALGEYAASKANLTYDPTNGLRLRTHSTTVLQLDNSGGASVAGVLNIGTNGGFYQGSGTFASPTTGLKIWNDSGIGRVGGYGSGTLQWYANTSGELMAGAGEIRLNSESLAINLGDEGGSAVIRFEDFDDVYDCYSLVWGQTSSGYYTLYIRAEAADTDYTNAAITLEARPNGGGSAYQVATLHLDTVSSCGITAAQGYDVIIKTNPAGGTTGKPLTRWWNTGNIEHWLQDAAGANKLVVFDSLDVEQFSVDSDGGMRVRGGAYIGSTGTAPGAGTLTTTDYIVALGGLHVGGTSDPGTDNLVVDGYASVVDYVAASGGVHVGGTSDPGTDNLVVDGYAKVGSVSITPATGQIAAQIAASGWLPFTVYQVAPYGLTKASHDNYVVFMASISRVMVVRSYHLAAYVVTTNDGSNYWTFNLCEVDGTQIATVNTSASSADDWLSLSSTGLSHSLNPATGGQESVYVKIVATGTPGTLYLGGPAVYAE